MSVISPLQLAALAVRAYRSGLTTFPRFVFELGRAASSAEALAEPAAAGLLRTWGQLEVVNALALDEGYDVAPGDADIEGLIVDFLVEAALPRDAGGAE